MTLHSKIMRRAEFDTEFAVKDSKNAWNSNPSDCHFVGMRHENERLQPLINALAKAVAALEYYALIHDSVSEMRIVDNKPAREAISSLAGIVGEG